MAQLYITHTMDIEDLIRQVVESYLTEEDLLRIITGIVEQMQDGEFTEHALAAIKKVKDSPVRG